MNRQHWLWIAPFCSFILGYLLLYFLLRVEHIPTPAMVGKGLNHALALLSNANLNARIIGYKQDPDIPQGTIISQTPRSGQMVRPNQSIFIVLSSQPPPVLAPNLIGTRAEQIKQIIAPQGIRSKILFMPSNYPAQQCIGQAPLPSMPTDTEPLLAYCAKTSCKPIIWPDFVQQPLETVLQFLANHHIAVNITHEKPQLKSTSVPDYSMVTDQRPLANSLLTFDPEHPPVVQLQIASSAKN